MPNKEFFFDAIEMKRGITGFMIIPSGSP